MTGQDAIRILFLFNLQYRKNKQVMPLLLLQLVLALCSSSSTMTGQDVILLLLPVQLHDDRKHKQVIPAPAAPTCSRTLSKQLYYGSTRCDSPSASCPIA